MIDKLKRCTSCKEELAITDFHKDISRRDGLSNRCKTCRCKYRTGITIKKCKACNEEFETKGSGKTRKYCGDICQRFYIRYKISKIEYYKLVKDSDNKCVICREPETNVDNRTGKIYKLAVDHCHSTGKVRGLLCGNCNSALGKFKDSKKLLGSAIQYLIDNGQ